jgi:RNA polymerase sigma factor (TIGR02999 family)
MARPWRFSAMSDVTQILSAIEHGDPQAAEKLLPLAYNELRKLAAQRLAQEKPGQTLQATALVHEAYVRLVGDEDARGWDSRGHFFAAAAEAMRRILVERARGKGRIKRGSEWRRVDLEDLALAVSAPPDLLLTLDDAITGLEAEDPAAAALVRLHYYAGLPLEQAGASLGISTATTYRHWAYARAWLACALLDDRA